MTVYDIVHYLSDRHSIRRNDTIIHMSLDKLRAIRLTRAIIGEPCKPTLSSKTFSLPFIFPLAVGGRFARKFEYLRFPSIIIFFEILDQFNLRGITLAFQQTSREKIDEVQATATWNKKSNHIPCSISGWKILKSRFNGIRKHKRPFSFPRLWVVFAQWSCQVNFKG